MRIGINCGHTVSGTVGCGTVDYIDESVEARNVGYALEDLLKKAGHTVYDCTNDYAPTVSSNLKQIVDMANSQSLDLFVSIHLLPCKYLLPHQTFCRRKSTPLYLAHRHC